VGLRVAIRWDALRLHEAGLEVGLHPRRFSLKSAKTIILEEGVLKIN
jgi:hypothetical protein